MKSGIKPKIFTDELVHAFGEERRDIQIKKGQTTQRQACAS